MLKSATLTPYLEPKTEIQNKEELINYAISKITPNEDTITLSNYSSFSFIKKIMNRGILENFIIFSCLIMLLCIGFSISQSELYPLVSKLLGAVITGSSLVGAWFFIESGPDWISWNEGRSLFLKENILTLFSNAADKNYEIRAEYGDRYSKLKIIIEENIYINGTTSVIKNSSKSLTAYINTSENKDSIIRSVIQLVKEAELKFK